jgi:hypothetical protein
MRRNQEMDHNQAIQEKATERYLLNELDPELRDRFEEHLFDCQECALDVRAAAMFVEQSKVILAEQSKPSFAAQPAPARETRSQGWFSWLRPAFAVPVFALLLAVVIYQNFVTYPHLMQAANQPQAIPWASVNVSTRGTSTTAIKAYPGQGFDLLVSIPQDPSYASYSLDLYSPSGKLQWSLKIPANSQDDTRSIHVPGTGLEQGTYKLSVTGINGSGQNSNLGSYPVELQIQN